MTGYRPQVFPGVQPWLPWSSVPRARNTFTVCEVLKGICDLATLYWHDAMLFRWRHAHHGKPYRTGGTSSPRVVGPFGYPVPVLH